MPYILKEETGSKTVEVKKKRISSRIMQYRSKNRKENNIAVLVETKNEADMKEIVEDIRKLCRKKNRLFDKGLSCQIHCSIISNQAI